MPTSSRTKAKDSDLLVSVGAGETIFQEGSHGEEMYIIESGEVELVKRFGPDERHLSVLGVGDFFGEISVLEEIPRTATARARTDCRLLPIDPSTFDHLLRRHPEVTVRMLRKLTRRLREIDEETERAYSAAAGVLAGVERGPIEPIDPAAVRNPAAFGTARVSPAQPDQQASQADDKDFSSTSSASFPTSDAVPPELPPEPPEHTAAHLVHAGTSSTFPVARDGKSVIGRFDPVTGTYPEIDLSAIDNRRSLSRRHARMWFKDGRFFVREELGVGNGTFLRDQRLLPGQDYEVFDRDSLKLGLVELTFRSDPESI